MRGHSVAASSGPRQRVLLRAPSPEEWPGLYEIECEGGFARPWLYRDGTPSLDDYVEHLYADALTVMAAIDHSTRRIVGVLVAYNADLLNGVVWVTVAIDPVARAAGVVVEALNAFNEYLFEHWNLHSLYFEVPDMAFARVSSALSLGARLHGRFERHDLIDDEFHDRVVVSLTKNTFVSKREGAGVEKLLHEHNVRSLELEQFVELIAQALPGAHCAWRPGMTFEAWGLDSLERYQLLALAEELSGWEIPEGLHHHLQTVEDVHDYIEKRKHDARV
jgi:RimJ/RimL family protein N-acetyltransferase/acyl carrier protein